MSNKPTVLINKAKLNGYKRLIELNEDLAEGYKWFIGADLSTPEARGQFDYVDNLVKLIDEITQLVDQI